MKEDPRGNLRPPEEHSRSLTLMKFGLGLGVAFAAAVFYLQWIWLGYVGPFLIPLVVSLLAALFHARDQWRLQEYQRIQREYQVRRNAILERYAPRG